MNKQGKLSDPFGGIEWTHYFGPMTGRTWNPVGGCKHGCRWTMPNGVEAVCYAETTAEGVASAAYPQGFASHYWHPERLDEPLKAKDPCGIFVDSMSDLFGAWVSDEEIMQVLDIINRAPWHVFFSLTKNAPRLLKFIPSFPGNMLVGVSMPPDTMFGKPLSYNQKRAMYIRTLDVLTRLKMRHVRTWMSYEPLSWDVTDIPMGFSRVMPLDWAVIGAASAGRDYFQPDPQHVKNLHSILDIQGVPVFHKGNLRWPWPRHDFPRLGSLSSVRLGNQ